MKVGSSVGDGRCDEPQKGRRTGFLLRLRRRDPAIGLGSAGAVKGVPIRKFLTPQGPRRGIIVVASLLRALGGGRAGLSQGVPDRQAGKYIEVFSITGSPDAGGEWTLREGVTGSDRGREISP
jgi:hypothetical protein